VAIGSPVEGELQRGDVILEIQSQNATNMTHGQAQDAIRNSGGSLSLRIKRLKQIFFVCSIESRKGDIIHSNVPRYNWQFYCRCITSKRTNELVETWTTFFRWTRKLTRNLCQMHTSSKYYVNFCCRATAFGFYDHSPSPMAYTFCIRLYFISALLNFCVSNPIFQMYVANGGQNTPMHNSTSGWDRNKTPTATQNFDDGNSMELPVNLPDATGSGKSKMALSL